jgi:hypothetical protein
VTQRSEVGAVIAATLCLVVTVGCVPDDVGKTGDADGTRKDVYVRPYGPNAPWNVPVSGLPRHPESDLYRDRLWNDAPSSRPGNFNLNFWEYTYPVYYVEDATGTYPVESRWGNLNGKSIPWNPEWQPAPGTDAQIILLDPAAGREWNFWQVEFTDGVIRASNANLVDGDYRTKEDGFRPSRGIGVQYLAMLVRPEEVRQGEIRHGLSMPIRNTDGTEFVAPATKLEHPGRPVGIPEGMRFALEFTEEEMEEWLQSLPPEVEQMKTYARIVGRALRDYGWFITDTSGGAHLQHEAWVTAGEEWSALGLETVEVAGKEYPRDLLDGLMQRERIYVLVPSDQYPG